MYKSTSKNQSVCRICFKDITQGFNFLEWLFEDEMVCFECRRSMRGSIKIVHKKDMEVLSFYEYKDISRTLILQFKDSKDKWLAPIFLYPFKLYLRIRYYHYDVVYVPSSKEQKQLRGYVPNELILENVFKNYIRDAFTKEDGYKQSHLSRELRVNVRKVIKRNKEVSLQNKKVLLFDDIVTTGNSLKACYDLLVEENKKVKIVVLFVHN